MGSLPGGMGYIVTTVGMPLQSDSDHIGPFDSIGDITPGFSRHHGPTEGQTIECRDYRSDIMGKTHKGRHRISR